MFWELLTIRMRAKTYISEVRVLVFAPPTLFSIFAISGILTVSGAFGTYLRMSYGERALYWGIVVSLAVIVVSAVKVMVDSNFHPASEWKSAAVVATIFTAIYTPMLWEIADLLTSEKRDYVTPFWMMLLIVFGMSMAVMQMRYLLKSHKNPERSKLFERLSDRTAHEIYRLTGRDHYVDVFTDRGMETLLMRFSDALAEVDSIKGDRVHRSHWVACDSMVRLDRSNGKFLLELKDGSRVPVSRSYREKVEARLA